MKFISRELLTGVPEQLVISGYRNMMAAYELGDTAGFEEIWRSFILELGAPAARRVVGEIQYWTRTVQANAGRILGFFPHRCLRLCEDECIAVCLVAAAQSGDDETGLFAATLLTGTADKSRNGDIWQASSHLAVAMQGAGRSLNACPRRVIRALNPGQRTAFAPPLAVLN